MHIAEVSDVPSEVRALVSQPTEPKPLRRGSVTERHVKCNKAGCPCARREDARHGPYYSVSRVVKERTQSRWLNAKQAQLVRHQVRAAQQFRKRCRRTGTPDAGKIEALLRTLRAHSLSKDEAGKCAHCIDRNRERMRYPAFRALGPSTSTGVVEAGCNVAIGTRLRRCGMHWTVARADAIIAVRCCKLSGHFEGFWERRPQHGVAA